MRYNTTFNLFTLVADIRSRQQNKDAVSIITPHFSYSNLF